MQAYRHNILYHPPLKVAEGTNDPSLPSIHIEQTLTTPIQKHLQYKFPFYNNQDRNVALYSDIAYTLNTQGRFWAYEVEDVVTFYWEQDTRTIFYIPQKHYSEALLQYWSLHQVLPLFFALEGRYTFLHTAAVEIEGRLVAFLANSFGGKSTLTNFFATQGHRILTDDKIGIIKENGEILAIPSHPYHRPYRNNEDLGIRLKHHINTPTPIEAFYVLKKSPSDASVTFTPLAGLDKFTALRFSTLYNFPFLKQKHFSLLGTITKEIPFFQVTVPWDLAHLPKLYEHICKHVKEA
jgi:hypothetical protein